MLYSVGTSTEQNTEKVLKNDINSGSKARDIVFTGVLAILIAVCSWISIPATVPFTLQSLGVFSAVGLLCWCALPLTVLNLLKIAGAVVLTDRLSKVVK